MVKRFCDVSRVDAAVREALESTISSSGSTALASAPKTDKASASSCVQDASRPESESTSTASSGLGLNQGAAIINLSDSDEDESTTVKQNSVSQFRTIVLGCDFSHLVFVSCRPQKGCAAAIPVPSMPLCGKVARLCQRVHRVQHRAVQHQAVQLPVLAIPRPQTMHGLVPAPLLRSKRLSGRRYHALQSARHSQVSGRANSVQRGILSLFPSLTCVAAAAAATAPKYAAAYLKSTGSTTIDIALPLVSGTGIRLTVQKIMTVPQPASLVGDVLQQVSRVIAVTEGHDELHPKLDDVAGCTSCGRRLLCTSHMTRIDHCTSGCREHIAGVLVNAHARIKAVYDAENQRLAQLLQTAKTPATLEAARAYLESLQSSYRGLLRLSELRDLQELLVSRGQSGKLVLDVTTSDFRDRSSAKCSVAFEGRITMMATTPVRVEGASFIAESNCPFAFLDSDTSSRPCHFCRPAGRAYLSLLLMSSNCSRTDGMHSTLLIAASLSRSPHLLQSARCV